MAINTLLVEFGVKRHPASGSELKQLIEQLERMGFTVLHTPLNDPCEVAGVSIACAGDSELVEMIVPTMERHNRITDNRGLLIDFYSVSITSPHENIAVGVASPDPQPLERLEGMIRWMMGMAKRNPPPLANWHQPVKQLQ